MIETSGEEH